MINKYFKTTNKYLAETMCFMGFKYYKFNDEKGIIYSFKNTDKFNSVLLTVINMKKNLNSQSEYLSKPTI